MKFLIWAVLGVFAASTAAQVESVSGTCAAGAEFTVFTQKLSFDRAIDFCANEGGTLARIGNANEHLRVVDLMLSDGLNINQAWIGNSRIFSS